MGLNRIHKDSPLSDGSNNFFCYLRFVHGVEVDAFHMVFKQITNLADGIINAGLVHILGIIAVFCNQVRQSLGNTASGEGYRGS